MTDPSEPPEAPGRPDGTTPTASPDGAEVPAHAGVPAPPGSSGGRARAFREEQARRRSAERERVGVAIVVGIIFLGVFAIVTAQPFSPGSGSRGPSPGPPIVVQLGTPSVSDLRCKASGTAVAELIPFTSSPQPITTGDVNVRVYEIWDGDFIADPDAVANATPSNLCAGPAPIATYIPGTSWYAVLIAPNGTNLLTYTVASGWMSITNGSPDLSIENGSTFALITNESLAGTGRGFALYGSVDGSSISGSVPL